MHAAYNRRFLLPTTVFANVAATIQLGLLAVGTPCNGQLITFTRPKVSVTLHHPAATGASLEGKKVAFGQISGPCAQQFSDLLVPVFQANHVEVVNRQQLDTILAEHRFQVSGSVDASTAVAIGKVRSEERRVGKECR